MHSASLTSWRDLDQWEGPAGAAAHPEEAGSHRLVPAATTVVSQVFSIEERGRDLFEAVQRLDLEGIVAKRKADLYRPETVWYKIKSGTYTQGEGRWELFQRK
jgi:hypothetical protein